VNQKEKNHEGLMHTSPPNPEEKVLEIAPRKMPRKRLRKSPKRRNGNNTSKP
jgi:hypothetical protein